MEIFLLQYRTIKHGILQSLVLREEKKIFGSLFKKVLLRTLQPQGPIDYALGLKRFGEALGKLWRSFGGLSGRKHCRKATLISSSQVNGQRPARLFMLGRRSRGVGQLKAFSLVWGENPSAWMELIARQIHLFQKIWAQCPGFPQLLDKKKEQISSNMSLVVGLHKDFINFEIIYFNESQKKLHIQFVNYLWLLFKGCSVNAFKNSYFFLKLCIPIHINQYSCCTNYN